MKFKLQEASRPPKEEVDFVDKFVDEYCAKKGVLAKDLPDEELEGVIGEAMDKFTEQHPAE